MIMSNKRLQKEINKRKNISKKARRAESIYFPDEIKDEIKALEAELQSLSFPADTQEDLEDRAEGKNWAYAFGSEEMTDAFGADRSPTLVIIDKDGMVTYSESGAISQSELEERINEALE